MVRKPKDPAKKANNDYEVHVMDPVTKKWTMEGVFTSLKEVAHYLDIPKATVTKIYNCEYDLLGVRCNNISIIKTQTRTDVQKALNNNPLAKGA